MSLKKKISLSIIILLLILAIAGCSDSSEDKTGNLVITQVNTGLKSYGSPYYYGKVKNTGNNTVYNTKVTFTIYQTENKENIIDTASGFPANTENIAPGETATFEAVAFDLSSTNALQYYKTKITFLNR